MAKPSITKRVTKGSALTYAELDTNFQNLTDATVTLRVPGTGGRIAKVVTVVGTPTISAGSFKFGGASLSKDINDYLTIPTSTDFAFGTGDFTVEMWVDRSRTNVRERLLEFRTSEVATLTPMLEIDSSNRIVYLTAGTVRIQGGTLTSSSGWHHVAVSRVSGVTRLFLDGVQIGSNYADTSNYSQHPCYIGRSVGGLFGYNGYIDELRVSKNIGRYSANFTPSTTAFANDTSTVLLLHFDTDYSDDAAAAQISVVSDLNGIITLVEGSGIDITGDNTAKTITITATGGLGTSTGISALIDDPIPTLGGPLDVNGQQIVSNSDGNIVLAPDGNGIVYIKAPLKVEATSGTPTTYENGYYEDMLQTPVSWLKIDIDGSNYYIPLFQ